MPLQAGTLTALNNESKSQEQDMDYTERLLHPRAHYEQDDGKGNGNVVARVSIRKRS